MFVEISCRAPNEILEMLGEIFSGNGWLCGGVDTLIKRFMRIKAGASEQQTSTRLRAPSKSRSSVSVKRGVTEETTMTLNDLKPLAPLDTAIVDLPAMDLLAWLLLPILLAILVVWAWRLLRAAAGILSWVILVSLLIFTATRLSGLIP